MKWNGIKRGIYSFILPFEDISDFDAIADFDMIGEELLALDAGGEDFLSDFDAIADFDHVGAIDSPGWFGAISDFDAISNLDLYGGIQREGFYEIPEIKDFGTLITFQLSVQIISAPVDTKSLFEDWPNFNLRIPFDGVQPSLSSAEMQIATSMDGIHFGDFRTIPIFSRTEITARAVSFRLRLFTKEKRLNEIKNFNQIDNFDSVGVFIWGVWVKNFSIFYHLIPREEAGQIFILGIDFESISNFEQIEDFDEAGKNENFDSFIDFDDIFDFDAVGAGKSVFFKQPFIEVPTLTISIHQAGPLEGYYLASVDKRGFVAAIRKATDLMGGYISVARKISWIAKGQ
jgi:hypothetical protein